MSIKVRSKVFKFLKIEEYPNLKSEKGYPFSTDCFIQTLTKEMAPGSI
ncbi:hypothetical protein ES703_91981 [subsurface metagenome]